MHFFYRIIKIIVLFLGLFSISKDLVRPTPQTFLHQPVNEHKLLPSGLQPDEALPPRLLGTKVRSLVHPCDSVLYNKQQSLGDAARLRGRSFRVGWGPEWRFGHSGFSVGHSGFFLINTL